MQISVNGFALLLNSPHISLTCTEMQRNVTLPHQTSGTPMVYSFSPTFMTLEDVPIPPFKP